MKKKKKNAKANRDILNYAITGCYRNCNIINELLNPSDFIRLIIEIINYRSTSGDSR